MSRLDRRMDQAISVLNSWQGSGPFQLHFKAESRKHREWGSRDRKEIQLLCYALFRSGYLFSSRMELRQKLAWSIYLFQPAQESWIGEWKATGILPTDVPVPDLFTERLAYVKHQIESPGELFPLTDKLSREKSAGLSSQLLALAMDCQPLLWFRCRPERVEEFREKLVNSALEFREQGFAFGLAPGTDLKAVFSESLPLFGEVQDLASQEAVRGLGWNGWKVWDTCCASGGKSLQLMQEYEGIQLYCTDLRPGILSNLVQRFQDAGLPVPNHECRDLSRGEGLSGQVFDALLCDLPCSGSGVFRRNPDSMYRFEEGAIPRYVSLQRSICKTAVQHLKTGGELLYVTCSVYADENECQFSYLESLGLSLQHYQYLNKLEEGGDVLFRALFKKT